MHAGTRRDIDTTSFLVSRDDGTVYCSEGREEFDADSVRHRPTMTHVDEARCLTDWMMTSTEHLSTSSSSSTSTVRSVTSSHVADTAETTRSLSNEV